MLGATLQMIGRLFGTKRPPFRKLVKRASAECSNKSDAELLALADKATGDPAYKAALLTVAAERGNTEGQFRLGQMLANGDVPTDRFPQGELSYRMQRAGVRWLTSAAEAGHSAAKMRLQSISMVDAGK